MSVPKTKILVIDDDPGVCEFLKLTLEKTRKYDVVVSTSGSEGLKLAEIYQPNLVLLDIMMPEMSGAEVAEKLVKNEKTCDIPIAFITGLLTKEDVEKRQGFIHGFLFISKPVTPKQLVEQVESVLAVITRQKAFVKSIDDT
jgi:CheY-like chemotaxis protein